MRTNALILLAVLLLISGCLSKVDLSKITPGMSKEQVIANLGRPKNVALKGNIEYFTYESEASYFDGKVGGEFLYVRFIDGKVESYGQKGDFGAVESAAGLRNNEPTRPLNSLEAATQRLLNQRQQDQAAIDAAVARSSENMKKVGEKNLAGFNAEVRASEERRAAEIREGNAKRAAILQSTQLSVPSASQPPQMPSGLGVPTGRSQVGLDGVTYYEVRDVNGTTYWTNKR